MNLNDLIIAKVKDINMYRIQCPNCGWKNSIDVMAKYCPKCGNDLKFMMFTEIGGLPECDECVSGVDLSVT